jgi:hypothetical protein
MRLWLVPVGVLLGVALLVTAKDDKKTEDGFTPLFNGKDLDGWMKVNSAPGTFTVKDGLIVTTGLPIGFLRSTKMYENFILEMEWKHLPPKPGAVGNSGLFVWADPLPNVGSQFTRAIEVQVLVNLEYKDKKSGKVTATSHGDLFSTAGASCVPDRPHPLGWARCLPSENRAKGAGEWNHYRVEAKDGVIKLAVNGKVVSGVSKCKPRKGYLALEAEGSECHFRNLKIKELPSSNPKPDLVAQEGQDFTTLFTGLNLDGWKVDDEQKKHWKVDAERNVLSYDGKATKPMSIQTTKEYGDFELILDCKFPAKAKTPSIKFRPEAQSEVVLLKAVHRPGKWHRYTIRFKGKQLTVEDQVSSPGRKEHYSHDLAGVAAKGPITLLPDTEAEFCNLFIRPLK